MSNTLDEQYQHAKEQESKWRKLRMSLEKRINKEKPNMSEDIKSLLESKRILLAIRPRVLTIGSPELPVLWLARYCHATERTVYRWMAGESSPRGEMRKKIDYLIGLKNHGS